MTIRKTAFLTLLGTLVMPQLSQAGWLQSKSSWMENIYTAAPYTRLRDMVIPGTHDSGTYAITSSSPLDPNESEWYYSLAKSVVANWAKTQDHTIYEQLRQGIRYLDLRVTRYNGDFWITHGMISVKLSTVLADVQRFADEHPREVVLLDFQKMPGSGDYAALQSLIDSYLHAKLLPVVGTSASVTLNDFWSRSKQIMALMDQSAFTSTRPNYWYRDSNLDGVWPNERDGDEVWADNNSALDTQDTNKFWVSQLIMTGQTSDYTDSVLGSCPCSLYELNRRIRTAPETWLRPWKQQGKKLNIVITDFYNEGVTVSEAIAANLDWDPARIVALFPTDYNKILGVDWYSRNEEIPKSVRGNWDAIYGSPQLMVAQNNGKTYFLNGDEYSRYDNDDDRVDRGYPKPITGFWGLPTGWESSDAGMEKGSGITYFFKGSQYVRYNMDTDKVDSGYPKAISGNWPGLAEVGFASNIDAAFNNHNGKYYFFKGTQYVRYDIAADRMDSGYPKPIDGYWGEIHKPIQAVEYGVKDNTYFMLKQDRTHVGKWTSSGGRSIGNNPKIALKLDTTATVTINLTSSVDAYLYLQGIAGNTLATDDNSGGGGNARVTLTLAAGVYRLIAATNSSGQSGSFQLTTTTGTLIGE